MLSQQNRTSLDQVTLELYSAVEYLRAAIFSPTQEQSDENIERAFSAIGESERQLGLTRERIRKEKPQS
jgi:hypothetical protein